MRQDGQKIQLLWLGRSLNSFGKETKDKRRIVIKNEHETSEYLIPKWRNITVFEGEMIEVGEVIVDGRIDPHMLLKLLGRHALAKYIIDEVQEVYRLQGVHINDKHIEVIIRQMTRKCFVTDSGDTNLMLAEQIDIKDFETANAGLDVASGQPAKSDLVLQGITACCQLTHFSAASFQETTRVLTDAAVSAKVDTLKGLKENVMVGRLIPAGTGFVKKGEAHPSSLSMNMSHSSDQAVEFDFDIDEEGQPVVNHINGDSESADGALLSSDNLMVKRR